MSTCKCKNNQTDDLKELNKILEAYGKNTNANKYNKPLPTIK